MTDCYTVSTQLGKPLRVGSAPIRGPSQTTDEEGVKMGTSHSTRAGLYEEKFAH